MNEHHRYNISVGAVRSGKTYLDLFRIPKRIRSAGQHGNVVLIGCTQSSLERNILSPMRDIWGENMVGRIRPDGRITLFGKECCAIGGALSSAAEKLRGMSIAYCYGDEITTWSEDVFRMIQSRLDREESVFDGTCNPDSPEHWFRKFLCGGFDTAVSSFTIADNPALPPAFVEQLKKEYAGTVWYDRFILGKWAAGEGIIYRQFAADTDAFLLDAPPPGIIMADIGVDFGGNGSAHAFSLTGYTRGYREIVTLDEYYRKEIISPAELEADFVDFVRRSKEKYPCLCDIYCDSAEQVLIRGLKNAAYRNIAGVELHNAKKCPVNDRIRFYSALMGRRRYFVMKHCVHTTEAFSTALWNGSVRMDNGSTNIDSLDAQEYSTEHRMNEILDSFGMKEGC